MKKHIIFSTLFFVIFFMASCSSISNISKSNITRENHAYLLTKDPVGFDSKLGYEILVYEPSLDLSKLIVFKVFVSRTTWKLLPEPTDIILVDIEYIESINYGNLFDIRYQEFNMCIDYNVYSK